MSTDLLGNALTPAEERLLAVYEELKALAGEDDLPPTAQANVRAALALLHNAVNGLALKYEHLSDVGPSRIGQRPGSGGHRLLRDVDDGFCGGEIGRRHGPEVTDR